MYPLQTIRRANLWISSPSTLLSKGSLEEYGSLGGWPHSSRPPSSSAHLPAYTGIHAFIQRHEILRKLAHVSMGLAILLMYSHGIRPQRITPWLLSSALFIAGFDVTRHHLDSVNQPWLNIFGIFLRNTEVAGYNPVIWFLLGSYIALQFFPEDVALMAVLLLSVSDTAASTFGRLYGRYTTTLRPGKTLAGSMAAGTAGVVTAACFWGYFVPYAREFPGTGDDAFMFTGRLCMDSLLSHGYRDQSSCGDVIDGPMALGAVSIVTGFVAAGSELVDVLGLNDNITIPVLSSVWLCTFFRMFG
ncbi:hypothetical protein BO70DRAFT_419048 [Aspergillus heteromorphus CBS 117.55]|uniref:Phosphatidate cytidylyltransferase n=1 Tax=Aspergillus heteromorphus CBS 117.55 TaxID=1448321 RepID=A0A317UZF2_9EURO|nr:uncharacterized protein BO70DRAFT_419048 [Aspergillus heteromorphus CBS 117.55]PWY66739.1 hypothetical protein BO70DRAFT_419048 [Aspergillus heteromorphus CBS 117.55]